jgi:hypothetical protein
MTNINNAVRAVLKAETRIRHNEYNRRHELGFVRNTIADVISNAKNGIAYPDGEMDRVRAELQTAIPRAMPLIEQARQIARAEGSKDPDSFMGRAVRLSPAGKAKLIPLLMRLKGIIDKAWSAYGG